MGDEEEGKKMVKISKNLFEKEGEKLVTLLKEYKDVFAWSYQEMLGVRHKGLQAYLGLGP